MLGRNQKSSPVPDPPEPEVIEEFSLTQTRGPREDTGLLRLDLDGPVRSPWNVRAAHCFRKNFNSSRFYHQWPNDLIEEAFLRHTETIRAQYRQQTGRVSASMTSDRRISSSRKSRLKTVNVISRVLHTQAHPIPQLIQNRRYVCDAEPHVSRFKTYVNRLADEDGMSGDETDHRGKQAIVGQRKFFVVRPAWRSQEVTDWLRVIDALYACHRFSTDGRATRGNWVRHRIDSDRVDRSKRPIRGLPKNFYDRAWLEGLPQEERDSLAIQSAETLDHSVEVLR